MCFGPSSFSLFAHYHEESEKPRTRSIATSVVERILAEHSEQLRVVDEVGGIGKELETR